MSIISPKLTTIKFENKNAGKVAANTIVNLIQERKEPLLKEIKFELIEGESTINKIKIHITYISNVYFFTKNYNSKN